MMEKLSYNGSFEDMDIIFKATNGKLSYDQQTGAVYIKTDKGELELKQYGNVVIEGEYIEVHNP